MSAIALNRSGMYSLWGSFQRSGPPAALLPPCSISASGTTSQATFWSYMATSSKLIQQRGMKVLVLNAGSSSLKYKLFDKSSNGNNSSSPHVNPVAMVSGLIERIGDQTHHGIVSHYSAKEKKKIEISDTKIANHGEALRLAVDIMKAHDLNDAKGLSDIVTVGHRVVNGGEQINQSCIVDDRVEKLIEEAATLAPLHNPNNLAGIRVAKEVLGANVPQVAVFDTTFHAKIPPSSYLYAIPLELYTKYAIRKYGFHGTSYAYVLKCLEDYYQGRFAKPKGERLNAILCHLGAGSSMACVKNGVCLDTTMGLTPLEGLVMGSRCGDIDASVVFHLCKTLKMGVNDVDSLLNKKSGLLGLCGDLDLRHVLAKASQGDTAAQNAYDVLVHRLRKYIGAYMVYLGGKVDVIAFTAGMGQNSAKLRRDVLHDLETLGVLVDEDANTKVSLKPGLPFEIQKENSRVKVVAIETDEELQIANESIQVIMDKEKVGA
mmetsp:Transcript_20510/g.35388  ORF Transcript_20510/g.35388 Transcript_20510/m.35388 type:complete len:489 (-) Transcript_20510:124-1590(-)